MDRSHPCTSYPILATCSMQYSNLRGCHSYAAYKWHFQRFIMEPGGYWQGWLVAEGVDVMINCSFLHSPLWMVRTITTVVGSWLVFEQGWRKGPVCAWYRTEKRVFYWWWTMTTLVRALDIRITVFFVLHIVSNFRSWFHDNLWRSFLYRLHMNNNLTSSSIAWSELRESAKKHMSGYGPFH